MNTNRLNQKKRKKGLLLPLALLAFCLFSATAVVIAYFSDAITSTFNITAGTLNIEVIDSNFYLNDVIVSENQIKNLNPGDAIKIKGQVSNVGNKSAWIREKISFLNTDPVLLDYLRVYNGEFSQSQLATPGVADDYLINLNVNEAISTNKVIDGSGEAAETEQDEGFGYQYLEKAEYDFSYTIYFLPTATNECQGKEFSINLELQALQYRNNNTAIPSESAWSTVTTVAAK